VLDQVELQAGLGISVMLKLFTYKFVFDSCFNFFLCLLFLQGYWGYCILVLEQISSRILYKIGAFIRASKHSLINPSNLSEYPRNRLHCCISLLHILCARASIDRGFKMDSQASSSWIEIFSWSNIFCKYQILYLLDLTLRAMLHN
jgi:hypothetical protein